MVITDFTFFPICPAHRYERVPALTAPETAKHARQDWRGHGCRSRRPSSYGGLRLAVKPLAASVLYSKYLNSYCIALHCIIIIIYLDSTQTSQVWQSSWGMLGLRQPSELEGNATWLGENQNCQLRKIRDAAGDSHVNVETDGGVIPSLDA